MQEKNTRLRILWIARTCPYPANDGEKLRVFNLLKTLSQLHDLTVIYRAIEAEEEAGATELRKFCKGVYGVRVPRPRGAVEKLRWMLPFLFSRYPLALCTVFFRPIAHQLAQLARSERYDIVQVEHSSLSIYRDHVDFAGDPATVLTMHNIDYLRNERVLRNTPWGAAKLYHWLNQRRFKRWELGVLARYDQVIAMSEVDREVLETDVAGLPVQVVPNGVDATAIPFAPAAAGTNTIIFVASMDSEANHDGAMFFLQEVWPLLKRQRPDTVLKLVGRGPNAELRAADNGNDVIVTGKVDDVLKFYREAAVAIVPLRSGGGTRLKILEAMAAGTAVVSTTIGCEGLEVGHERDILIADEPAALAEAIRHVLDDEPARAALVHAARELVETRYDWKLIARQHQMVYQEALRVHDSRR